jgi:hypothetical protein
MGPSRMVKRHMTVEYVVIGGIAVIALANLARELWVAPLGREDADGFHVEMESGEDRP